MKGRKFQRGFTLIELLVVIAIIGILASIVLVSLSGGRAKALDVEAISNLKGLKTALELYATANGSYPTTGGAWRSECSGYGGNAASDVIPGLVPTYMQQMPSDPRKVDSTSAYCYLYQSNGTNYKVFALNFNKSDIAAYKPYIDQRLNAPLWGGTAPCGGADTRMAWSIWSSETSRCW